MAFDKLRISLKLDKTLDTGARNSIYKSIILSFELRLYLRIYSLPIRLCI